MTNASQLTDFLSRYSIWARAWVFPKNSNEVGLFILSFFQLILEVLSNATPGGMHESPWVWTQPKAKSYFFGLVPMLVLVPIKTDLIIKEQSYKRSAVGAKNVNGMYQNDLQTSWWSSWWPAVSWQLVSTWRNESIQNFVIVPRCTLQKLGWGLDLMHRLVWGLLFGEAPQSIWIKQEYGEAFLQEQEPNAITANFEIVLTEFL